MAERLNVTMETKTGKISKKISVQYESPLGYVIEDVRPHGGSEKYRTAVYSNVRKILSPSHALSFYCCLNGAAQSFSNCGALGWAAMKWAPMGTDCGTLRWCSACGSLPDIPHATNPRRKY